MKKKCGKKILILVKPFLGVFFLILVNKNSCQKRICDEQFSSNKISGENEFLVEKILVKKNLDKKNSGQKKILMPKKIW